ncbi:MAG: hypothetical protein EHM61_27805 [Acidobacteria bacterium]|nr:MAG: hypothetical protein EHM61_27805 [Acidobacteriota bacterium]
MERWSCWFRFSLSRIRSSGQDHVQKGVVIQSLAVKADPTQTYALFLPPEYNPGTKWPVLLSFAENGYSSPARLEEDSAFDFLRPEPEFRQLVQTIQTNHQKAR